MDRLRCDRFGVESNSGLGVKANSGLPGKGEGNVCMICGEVMESFSSAVAHLTKLLLSLEVLDLV